MKAGIVALLEGVSLCGRVPAVADNSGVTGYPSDLNDAQWAVLSPYLLDEQHKRGRKHVPAEMRRVVNGLLYIAHTGCQWRYLPKEYGPWERVWSQFRRWAANGTLGPVLLEVHADARIRLGRPERWPSLIVIDSSLARGASNGGATFHAKGGNYGGTNGAKRVIAVDATGLPLAGVVFPANIDEPKTVRTLLHKLDDLGAGAPSTPGSCGRLTKVMVDAGTTDREASDLGKEFGVNVAVYSQDPRPNLKGYKRRRDAGPRPFHPFARAWRVEVAHAQLGRSRRLSRSFENTTDSSTAWLELACIRACLDL